MFRATQKPLSGFECDTIAVLGMLHFLLNRRHEREWFSPKHENCEGTTGIRNRLLRGQGGVFR